MPKLSGRKALARAIELEDTKEQVYELVLKDSCIKLKAIRAMFPEVSEKTMQTWVRMYRKGKPFTKVVDWTDLKQTAYKLWSKTPDIKLRELLIALGRPSISRFTIGRWMRQWRKQLKPMPIQTLPADLTIVIGQWAKIIEAAKKSESFEQENCRLTNLIHDFENKLELLEQECAKSDHKLAITEEKLKICRAELKPWQETAQQWRLARQQGVINPIPNY